MAITKARKKPTADDFIAAAPDALKSAGVKKGNKLQISLTIDPELLIQVDQGAVKISQSRAGFINLAIIQAVKHGLLRD